VRLPTGTADGFLRAVAYGEPVGRIEPAATDRVELPRRRQRRRSEAPHIGWGDSAIREVEHADIVRIRGRSGVRRVLVGGGLYDETVGEELTGGLRGREPIRHSLVQRRLHVLLQGHEESGARWPVVGAVSGRQVRVVVHHRAGAHPVEPVSDAVACVVPEGDERAHLGAFRCG
jgi:hypothetical protein